MSTKDSNSEEFLQWLTGFWEGDGSMAGSSPHVRFIQKDPRILEYIVKILDEPKHKIRQYGPVYHLILAGSKGRYLLQVFSEHVVSLERASQLNEYALHAKNFGGLKLPITSHHPSLPWIYGFFDAEGHIAYSKTSVTCGISQKGTSTLEKIQRIVGGRLSPISDKYNAYSLNLRKEESKAFLPKWFETSKNFEKREKYLRAQRLVTPPRKLLSSEEKKLRRKNYYLRKAKPRNEVIRATQEWLKANPDKTIQDLLEELRSPS